MTPRVAIVGGGLAGLAAAAALADRGLTVELFEAKRQLAGRAGSFWDPASDGWIDHCQHVSMGCCTNLADFCRRTDIAQYFRRDRVLHFFSPDGRRYDLAASRCLPAPLHLGPSFLRLGYLTLGERIGIARALWRLGRMKPHEITASQSQTIGQWLRAQRQSPAAIERFWTPVLVSALSEEVDQASLAMARKVFVEGFMSARTAYEVEVPRMPLGELYGASLEGWFAAHGVRLHLSTPIERLSSTADRVNELILVGDRREAVDAVVLALPWRRVGELIADPALNAALPQLARLGEIESAPITGIHLWFDRPITPLPHAVLVGTLAQWVFARDKNENYYQVVISASRNLSEAERAAIVERVRGELAAVFPAAREAKLLRWRMVTQQEAVFSVRPGIEQLRPPQRTAIGNLALAGDWTATGWPATMEGAVRSGYLAAEAILEHLGRPARLLVDDLKPARLARWLFPALRKRSG